LNGYPYVLRDYADPLQNMVSFLGINAERLEKLEERLKADVIKEAKSMGGLILVHQELRKCSKKKQSPQFFNQLCCFSGWYNRSLFYCS
jgi:hypothetical protein